MHSHHSHSSDHCQHASSPLDDMIQRAIDERLLVLCLTEHMPRIDPNHLYPEEIKSNTTVEQLKCVFDTYYKRARQAQIEYKDRIDLLVGFESETISDEYLDYIDELRKQYKFDMVVGSVHHVSRIPIDYNEETWIRALDATVGTLHSKTDNISDESLQKYFEEYFDLQYLMLKRLKPSVVGHFDLIKLCAPKGVVPESLQSWPSVWEKITRNVKLAVSQGGLFEVNSAAVRKGWDTPYPGRDIASLIHELGGEFCLSDDSHQVGHVAQNYKACIRYLKELGVERVYYLKTKRLADTISIIKDSVSLQELDEWATL
ncbi:histidinol-phosphatase [Sugiyamaella lignohabitans]|uniref:Histidinol-phosphatase n=1 Tax=Sugiyamaella lignohabitans TaxID=796027 RepID=A0A161HEY8_9ASCO|nr:histidinol-phosphatase [Sugiyamaella lignohabitans]ANB10951.1 histidinol-phosphatase [Sugiyamaella lignohabitans]